AIACPTLVVRGTRSNVLSEEVAHQMVRTLADGRLVELEAGHNVPLDRPRELADAAVVLAT
ncbi:MAG: alpha/beta hydrolase, partial [Chloroflexota bacterium]|nr:alpha/beta hydrolase [Chloroflexota bacterium]